MKQKQEMLGTFEALLLSAILSLDPEAYGNPICDSIAAMSKNTVSLGAIYTTADRLETKGYITSETRSLGPGRPGRARRYMRLTGLGHSALNEYRDMQTRRDGIIGIKLQGASNQ